MNTIIKCIQLCINITIRHDTWNTRSLTHDQVSTTIETNVNYENNIETLYEVQNYNNSITVRQMYIE